MLCIMADFMKRKWRLLQLNVIQKFKQSYIKSREVNEEYFVLNHT